MREITKDGELLARHILATDMHAGLNFYSDDKEFIQVGAWQYEEGKELLAHVHNVVPRTINRTYEVLYIINGKLLASIYDLDGKFAEDVEVNAGDILILLESGHGYRILEEGTKVLEVKNGPYLGADEDRHRI